MDKLVSQAHTKFTFFSKKQNSNIFFFFTTFLRSSKSSTRVLDLKLLLSRFNLLVMIGFLKKKEVHTATCARTHTWRMMAARGPLRGDWVKCVVEPPVHSRCLVVQLQSSCVTLSRN